ncbi:MULTISPECIES: hypothetical protein [Robertmurraya]|uniref:Integrase n=1 Tax=Robertmurraya beringensis TaxID=641660 RepID=A0ABV6KKQ2_9BACI
MSKHGSFTSAEDALIIEEFNDYKFDLESSMELAKEILLKEHQLGTLLEGEFEKDIWVFANNISDTTVTFDFNKIYFSSLREKISKFELINIIKCWITSLLSRIGPQSVQNYYHSFLKFCNLTDWFNSSLLKETKRYFEYKISNRQCWDITIAVLNFLDYFEDLESGDFLKLLLKAKSNLKTETFSNTRSLPPSKEVILFSWILEDFFNKTSFQSDEYYRYFPIFLWWNLTNLIPIRPSEFCKMDRNCLFSQEDKYYVKLPRIKQKNNVGRIQIIDTILIPKELFEIMNEYKNSTSEFGFSETFISYMSTTPKQFKKVNAEKFNLGVFEYILLDFYTYIVAERYGYSVKFPTSWDKARIQHMEEKPVNYDVTQPLKPGDTRHFAFLNLMRQGYHPVEIARLGGHTKLQSQYHYHQHQEYWVDTEILQLMQKFKINIKNDSHGKVNAYSLHLEFGDYIKEHHIFRPPSTTFKRDLEIGYCTDPEQYCQTDCFSCDYWRITDEEYFDKASIINEELAKRDNEVKKLSNVLSNLHKLVIKNAHRDEEYAEFNPHINKDLLLTKYQLDSALYRSIKFRGKIRKR